MRLFNSSGFSFSVFKPASVDPFDQLFELFKELVTHTSGDVEEALDWLRQLDKEYKLTNSNYTIDDFIEDLKKRGYLREEIKPNGNGNGVTLTQKTASLLRKHAFKQLFGRLKKSGRGHHKTNRLGEGLTDSGDLKSYQFGDAIDKIDMTESFKNALSNKGLDQIQSEDFVVQDHYHQAQMSTVLMIDISHSMILYGEDRITPAKKVAMALSELITSRYPKDKLDIIVFGNDAMPISIQELPYLQVGPYHTNTVAGLELAMDILRRRKNSNKQIFMITDGKPSCLREPDGSYYKNSVGLDPRIVERCYTKAQQARRLHIPITTFMIAQDPYLKSFVQEFTKANRGKAFYTGLKGLGDMIFEDYETNRKKKLK